MNKQFINSLTNNNDIKDNLINEYPFVCEKIESTIKDIRESVQKSNPEDLMNYVTSMNYLLMIGKDSESSFSPDEDFQMKALEYIQSILVSSTINQDDSLSDAEKEKLYSSILNNTCELYELIQKFILCWIFKNQSNLDENTQEYIIISQLSSFVRGNQYQNFRIDVLSELLKPHENEIKNAYGITADELIHGLKSLEKNLSTGKLDAIKELAIQMDLLPTLEIDALSDEYREKSTAIMMRIFSLALYDVKNTTEWPDELVNDLTYDIGEDKDFFSHDEFPGWPIWNLPVQSKPCIRINGISYTFDYYNFFDNFYRSFQKSIVKRIDDGVTIWKDIQSHTSERLIGNVFQSLLPGCIVHTSNYYPTDKRNSAENDILIEYKDVLIIIEVKAGAFTYTPALTDLAAHKKSLKELVEKADKQCLRTRDYIYKNDTAVFYSGNDIKDESFRISKSNYSQLFMFDVTIDDFNEIASCIERIKIADIKEEIITISLNDLWIYKDYFDNPLLFIHFLSQRTAATRLKSLMTFDELDHLGLYIQHNLYTNLINNEALNASNVFVDGYRYDLDLYFTKKYQGKSVVKPEQKLPPELLQLIHLCESKDSLMISHFTNFLLDMSSETRLDFCNYIRKICEREKETGQMFPVITFGELSFCLFVDLKDIHALSKEEQIEYVFANLANNGNEYCYLIEVDVDNDNRITDVKFDYLMQKDIPQDRYMELKEKGKQYVANRISVQSKKYGVKIGRNEQCPCGSGKKYKKCCGNKLYKAEL